jgi:hypothetical protein
MRGRRCGFGVIMEHHLVMEMDVGTLVLFFQALVDISESILGIWMAR